MSWIAIIVDPNDNKVRIEKFLSLKNRPQHNPRKLVLVYIIEFGYKYRSYCYSISLSIL